ncbi:MAG: DUF3696 domain-containing protein [Magnetococcales bacterium]|nr:DUF3696 domain-containing protein [Magnetococcales bacterium]
MNLSDRFLHCEDAPTNPPSFLIDRTPGLFTYLSALRDNLEDVQMFGSVPDANLALGCHGENIAEVLRIFGKSAVLEALRHPRTQSLSTLSIQVEQWMSEFVPRVKLRVEICAGLDAVGLRYLQGGYRNDWVRPANTGFGLTYCLPIVVAGLLARPGSLFIVDSPEAHLHPAAQSAMGQFLARLAAQGIQVVIETHSDHIINGIRLAAVHPEHPFQSREAQFHFLDRNDDELRHHSITMTASGGLSEYPGRFFDQSEIDLRRIIDARTAKP